MNKKQLLSNDIEKLRYRNIKAKRATYVTLTTTEYVAIVSAFEKIAKELEDMKQVVYLGRKSRANLKWIVKKVQEIRIKKDDKE